MKREIFACSYFVVGAAVLVTALHAQTSPWPFPPRPGAAPQTFIARSITVAFWNIHRTLMSNGFAWIWQNVPAMSRMTLPPAKDFPAACFDHVFYRGATLRRAWVANTSSQSSDHRAIVATFDRAAVR